MKILAQPTLRHSAQLTLAAIVQSAFAELGMGARESARAPKNIFKFVSADKLRCIFSSSPKMKNLLRRKWQYAVATVLLLALSRAGLVFWRAQRVLLLATLEVRSHEMLRFSVRNLALVSSHFEWINAPEAFSGAALFKGEFYLCGASGLFRYDSRGTPQIGRAH